MELRKKGVEMATIVREYIISIYNDVDPTLFHSGLWDLCLRIRRNWAYDLVTYEVTVPHDTHQDFMNFIGNSVESITLVSCQKG